LSSEEIATDNSLKEWARLRDAGRDLNRVLRTLGTSFPQWRVLYATERLIRETGDCVSQKQVSERAGMDANTLCDVMRRLERKGLVNRAPDDMDFEYRVLVTEAGAALLKDAQGAMALFSLNLALYREEDH
jgi:DNA-binding MarR family transcriptional regulator